MSATSIYPGEVFANATAFDSGIRQLLPHYDFLLDTLVACIPPTVRRVLELGCGTGELSLKLLERFPTAQLLAIDYSPRMVATARKKLTAAGLASRSQVLEMDFGAWAAGQYSGAIGKGFDACVSSLAIHHLEDGIKQQLFRQIALHLQPDGCFWNADPVLLPVPQLSKIYQAVREAWTASTGTTLELVRSQLGSSQPQGYSGQDRLATLEAHLDWLKASGFEAVATPYQYFGLAVFGGWLNGCLDREV